MIEHEPYRLKEAAKILGCWKNEIIKKDDIIKYGAHGKLPMYIRTTNYIGTVKHTNSASNVKIWERGSMVEKYLKLDVCCIQKLEAGDKKAVASIESQSYDEMGNDGLTQNVKLNFELEPISDEGAIVINLSPVFLRNCDMFVMADDLKRLQQATPQDEATKDDGKAEVKLEAKGKTDRKRNQIAKIWLEAKSPDLEAMRNPEIVNQLEAFSHTLKDKNGLALYKKGIFTRGGKDWLSRDHSVIPKRDAGRKPSK